MSPDAPASDTDARSVNGAPVAGSRIDAAWRHLAEALVAEAQRLTTAIIDDAAAAARARIARTIPAGAADPPSSAEALTLGATIGIVGTVLLTPRVAHDRG